MGQQQILLIVISMIVVGIAIAIAINYATLSYSSANRDAVIADIHNIIYHAQQYYRKPMALGGGGYSFLSYTIPSNFQETPNGTYTLTIENKDMIYVVGVGKEIGDDKINKVKVDCKITPEDFSLRILN